LDDHFPIQVPKPPTFKKKRKKKTPKTPCQFVAGITTAPAHWKHQSGACQDCCTDPEDTTWRSFQTRTQQLSSPLQNQNRVAPGTGARLSGRAHPTISFSGKALIRSPLAGGEGTRKHLMLYDLMIILSEKPVVLRAH
jgi:hypothetical protein